VSEFVGYAARPLSGYFSDKTRQYWLFTFIGYILNLGVVPLLAFAKNWHMAFLLIILERFGKALRTPPRDAMLSHATKNIGHGWGFGLHESLDQIGAVIGPLLISLILFFQKNYIYAFASLIIPSILSLLFLIFGRITYPKPEELEIEKTAVKPAKFPKMFWIYCTAIGCIAVGFIDYGFISYHFQKNGLISPSMISFFYAIAMGMDGISALIIGKLFDKKGISVFAFVIGTSLLLAPIVFISNFYSALLGMIFWGIGMGSQELLMRSAVAKMIVPSKRATAYGILNLIFGICWAIGSIVKGLFYDLSVVYLVIFSILFQLIAIPIFSTLSLKKK
jgi:predicted MFS family arabinose efflux permease